MSYPYPLKWNDSIAWQTNKEPLQTRILLWSSISAKNRSLYSILNFLYFMLSHTMRHPTVLISWLNFSIVHGTFCFSHSMSRIWHANLTIFCSFDKKVNYASFDFRSFVFNIQVVLGFVRHPSAVHWESTSRAQVISTPLPTVAVAINPEVEWSRENDPTPRRKFACVHSLKMAERGHADASAASSASLTMWCQNDHRRNTPIHRKTGISSIR